jgi:hypothetical protein
MKETRRTIIMIEKTLVINIPKEVYDFVAAAAACPVGANIYASRGSTSVPCVSIMGVFSLDTSIPFVVSYPNVPETKEFEKYISQFEIEGEQ